MMYWGNGDWSWVAWLAMTASMLAFWGLVAWAVVALVRRPDWGDHRADRMPTPAPEDVLAERFARGEIDEEEFLRRREVLRSNR